MLTGDLVRPRLRQQGNDLRVDWLDPTNPHWQRTAAELIAHFGQERNQPQEHWQRALDTYEAGRTDYNVIRGLAKVLSDAATFAPVETVVDPVELRARLFRRGPAYTSPDLRHSENRERVLSEVAVEYNVNPGQLEHILYADRPAAYLLTDSGPDWTTDSLIARYNLELARAALYWADQMTVHIYDGFKDFWKYVKLFKLMFEGTVIVPEQGFHGYSVVLDGPISPFVTSTTRYGRQLAAFLPALFLGNRWRMWATVRVPHFRKRLVYYLDDGVNLVTHFKTSGEFDSRMEADFAADFHEKFGDERGHWLLTREDEVILLGDTVMIPDFALTHKKDGRRAVIEIVGFWHPEYLERKVAKAKAANRTDLILLVYEGVNLGRERLQDVPSQVLYFKNKPVLKEVMALVEQVAV
ncbi:MAG: DUF790 family protein [Caldilineaceae bacterium]